MANVIKVEKRESFGKGASRQLRRENRTPAVLYGFDEAPVHLSFDAHEIYMEVRGNSNALLTLELDGKKQLALVKDVQRNPLSRIIEHVDLFRVKADQKVEVEVPIVTEGEPFAGAVAAVEMLTLLVLAPADSIPEHIVVSVEGIEDGTTIRVADLELPEGVETAVDPEAPVIVVSIPAAEPTEATEDAEAVEAE
ncbi:large subunit ribosomal protein L25 [Arcanobacterium pluranimalium]|uniref:50S ribosomal protein L25/general stress protein Ctc n=1 Tax=Arcanobacterium pluranimalium TaxID=108028 RepID=UPI00195A142B|nr:50S ribosomal protein L25/general stress protein Ctc [Arcanobacterium pluranimalium]MBM7824795.1 large subunit ribosomal protein L25 [Arcanobacterium pluranimalium]